MEYSLYDLLVKSAYRGLTLQLENGSFPKGHDGPWNHDDTHLRTTAHWTMLLLKAYKLTGDKKFHESACKALEYIADDHARPFNFSFHCRNSKQGINRCNGLIGQAWVLEPLITAGMQFNEPEYSTLARDVIRLHPYNFESHAWSAIDIDGTDLGEYKTLNQQIWFGAMAHTLGINSQDENILCLSRDFFSNLPKKINQFDGGIIYHTYTNDRFLMKRWTRNLVRKTNKNGEHSFQRILSISYMPFLLYGIAYIIDTFSSDFGTVFDDIGFLKRAAGYIEKNFPYGFLESPDSYRWSYNPVGIEMAYILQVLSDKEKTSDLIQKWTDESRVPRWLIKQLEGYFDFKKQLLNKNTSDPEILSSRLYEAVRLKDYKLNLVF